MPPAFEPSQLPPTALAEALRALPPRPAALLRRRLALREPLEACAAFYGVKPEALSTHLLREALALTAQVGGTVREPTGPAEEEAWARQLAAALERPTGTVSPGLSDTVALCQRFLAVRAEIEAAIEAAERAEARSPRRRREDVLRRLAVGLLLALAAYFYWKRPPEPEPRPRPPLPAAR